MLPIHPDTKVGALLDAYPGIEDVLIARVPAFSRLRNPILRRTVAKVATLEQAARVGGISARELVILLRQATGQSCESAAAGEAATQPEPGDNAWTATARVRETIDASAMLKTGVHPLGRVRQAAARLAGGEAVLLLSPFRPEPLLAEMIRGGFRIHCREAAPDEFHTLIARG